MIYTTGTIAISGNTLTGTGTNFTAAGSLIRNGCTVIALTIPAQVFQITAIGSATSLTVTPAANPAIPAGTKYAILLSDSLSVDGLAQDIAETFGMYQKYMGGFADVMNGSGDVTITINGTPVTVPGQKSLAKKGANSDITSLGGLTTPLSLSQGGTGALSAAEARVKLELDKTVNTEGDQTINGTKYFTTTVEVMSSGNALLRLANTQIAEGSPGREYIIDGNSSQLVFASRTMRNNGTGQMRHFLPTHRSGNFEIYTTANTTKAADGTLKAASPVVKLFADGKAETNAESEGCSVTRRGVGEYLIEGCKGLNADAAWGGIDGGFDIPADRNKQPLIWLDYEVNEGGSVLVKTYHRTYPDAPVFARNEREGFAGGDPIDIPADQFVSVRVEMPQNSIWNLKVLAEQKAAEEADRIEAQRVAEAKRIAAEKVQDEGEQSQS